MERGGRCPNKGCGEKILKHFVEEHLSVSCPRRKEKCSVCLEMVAHEDIPSHPDLCPKVEVKCSNLSCSVKLFRGELKVHQNINFVQSRRLPALSVTLVVVLKFSEKIDKSIFLKMLNIMQLLLVLQFCR